MKTQIRAKIEQICKMVDRLEDGDPKLDYFYKKLEELNAEYQAED